MAEHMTEHSSLVNLHRSLISGEGHPVIPDVDPAGHKKLP